MEKYRKQYSDELKLTISRLIIAQKREKEILDGLPNLNLSSDIFNKKKEQISLKLTEREEEIKKLEKRKDDYNTGLLDEEITTELEKNKNKQKQIVETAKQKRKEQKKENSEKKTYLEKGRDKEKVDRYLEKDYNYYHKQFLKSNDTLPDYMRDNLKNMPENKGYIWRGCWFFGERYARRGEPLIMFEKNRGVLQIHEITDTYHKIYEKKGNYKNLISSVSRKKNK